MLFQGPTYKNCVVAESEKECEYWPEKIEECFMGINKENIISSMHD
jgi:hypothetical protein